MEDLGFHQLFILADSLILGAIVIGKFSRLILESLQQGLFSMQRIEK